MRLALLALALAACAPKPSSATHATTPTRPPTSAAHATTATATTPAPAAAPAAAALPRLDAASGTCGAFSATHARLDVVDHRLTVLAPAGAADIPRAYDIMSAPQPEEHESRLIVEDAHGGKLVVYAHELWQTAGPDLAAKAPGYFASVADGAALDLGRVDAGAGVTVIGAMPKQLDTSSPAVLLLATIVRAPDATLLGVDYYVDPTAAAPGCKGLALELARGITVGTRTLDQRGGTRALGRGVVVDVPRGFVVTHQPGPDFDVYFVRELRPLGAYAGEVLVYRGDYPDRTVPTGPGTVVSRAGTLAGRAAIWQGFRSKTGGQLVATVALGGREQLQVQEVATRDGSYLDALDRIAATIRTSASP